MCWPPAATASVAPAHQLVPAATRGRASPLARDQGWPAGIRAKIADRDGGSLRGGRRAVSPAPVRVDGARNGVFRRRPLERASSL